MNSLDRNDLVQRIQSLSDGQLGLMRLVIDAFDLPTAGTRNEDSEVVSGDFFVAFGDFLKLHHCLSKSYLDKTRFGVALERILSATGRAAATALSGTNRGHDITVDGERWSLKTHGEKSIKADSLFISKFMELGSGPWGDTDLNDLSGLRQQFLGHLQGYDRVFQLRYFPIRPSGTDASTHRYELVEIPKALLLEAASGELRWAERSRTAVRCGYCTVTGDVGVKFRLYFDGGGERKLQIKDLRIDLCKIHATWIFTATGRPPIPVADEQS